MESAREYNLYFLVGNGPSSVSTKRIVTVGNSWPTKHRRDVTLQRN